MTNPALILIVDDVAANRDALGELLQQADYRLIEAAGGAEALRLAAETPPDLILLDVMMPGMDGFEVCRRLRADGRLGDVPIIILTALDDQASRLAGIEAGADDFITKPFNRAELRARVRTITRLNRYRRLADAHEALRQAEKMESIGRLAGGIAHDFNNLLTVINGTAELVLEAIDDDDPRREDLSQILKAGESAATLTRQLLAFSRRQMVQPKVVSVGTVIAETRAMLQRLIGEDITLAFRRHVVDDFVKADIGQLEQVVVNLAVNGRDAMPSGGTLTIEVATVEALTLADRPAGEAMPQGPYVMLAVSDTGTGIDRETRQKMFEPFFTTKGPGRGTGLGLSTVYGIVRQSNGFLSVESEAGRGTRFMVYLPRVAAESVPAEPAAIVAAARPDVGTVLVVDDDDGLRKLVARILERAGYIVLSASTGESALGELARHEGPVHVLLADVVMVGMGGTELARRFGETQPGMKVIYMSGHSDDEVLRRGILDASMHFLGKPFTSAQLLEKVRRVLDAPGANLPCT